MFQPASEPSIPKTYIKKWVAKCQFEETLPSMEKEWSAGQIASRMQHLQKVITERLDVYKTIVAITVMMHLKTKNAGVAKSSRASTLLIAINEGTWPVAVRSAEEATATASASEENVESDNGEIPIH